MKLKFFIFNFSFFIFIVGCSVKTTPIYAVIKSPNIKIADEGFLKESIGYKEIIIYKAGMKPFKVTIKNTQICLNNQCMDKTNFIKRLNKKYPQDFFDLILNRKPLDFLGKITFTKNGFIQKKDGIVYKVTMNKVLFKDKNKNILIMIKFLKGKG